MPRSKPDQDKSKASRTKSGTSKAAKVDEKPQHLSSLRDVQARLDLSLKGRAANAKGQLNSQAKEMIYGSKEHHDLESFLEFTKRNRPPRSTTVYRGTLYEYTVMEALKSFGFDLHRTGKSNDKGIDFLGHWNLPGEPHQMKVLVQCKLSRATPATMRELEGSYAGAPSEWQGDSVLALMASSESLTKGALEAVQRSPSPMGALYVDPEGQVRQFVWNAVAGERGLAGVGVTSKYIDAPTRSENAPEGVTQPLKVVSLTWNGQPLTGGAQVKEDQAQTKDDKPKAKEDQSQAEEDQPQAKENQPQAKESQPED